MKTPRIKTTVVGSYPLPDWLAAAPSEQALEDATAHFNKNAPSQGLARAHGPA